jgi:hypothetical protein
MDTAENVTQLPKRAALDRHQHDAEHVRRVHWYTAASGTTIDELMDPAYWERIAKYFSPLDRIEIIDDDRSFFAELLVLDTAGGLTLKPLRGVELHGTGARDAIPRHKSGVHAIYKGPHLRWCAFRNDVLLRDKFPTEAACLQWIAGNNQATSK